MALHWIICIGAALISGLVMAQELIDTQFAAVEQRAGSDANPRVTGQLPAGWQDNSEWAQVWVDYRVEEQEARRFLNVHVTRLEDGRAQMQHFLPKIEEDAYFRLEWMARSPTRQRVQVGVRQRGTPYEFLWQEQRTLGAGWEKLTHDFHVPAHPADVSFFINLSGPGELHLASLKLTRYTRDAFAAEMAKSFPAGSPPNLLRHSTFPLGLQSGWNLWRELSDGDEVKVAAAAGLAPGRTAMEITAEKNWVIHSAPFAIARPTDKHTASAYAKGNGTIRLTVFADGRELGAKAVEVKPDAWTRVETVFAPVLLARAHVIKLEGGAHTLVDGVQVNAGESAGELAMQMACEVSLAVDSPARVLFEDEPAVVRYAIAGGPQAARLKARVVNAYGEEREVPAERLTPASDQAGTVGVDLFPERPLGALRVEAWVEDSAGAAISPVSELVVLRVQRPRYWGKDAPDSPFGVHTLSANRHVLMAKSVGVNWVRLHDAGTGYIGWRYLEPAQGKWVFHDRELARYRAAGLKILGAFSTSPNWASYFPGQAHNGYFDQFYLPRNWDDFANYVQVAAQHHKGVIDTYDIWNEPWIHAWWAVGYDTSKAANNWDQAGYVTSENPAADFAHMTRIVVDTAKAVDPSIRILGVNSTTSTGFANSMPGREWTQRVVEAGGELPADVYCYHQYTDLPNLFPGDSVAKGFDWAMGPIREKHGTLPKPVWMTEGSALRDRIGEGLYKHTVAGRDDVMQTADGLVRYVVSLLAHGVEKVFLYSMHSHEFFGKGGDWRVLVTSDGYLHPSAAAHAAMAWLLEDSRFVEHMELAPQVHAYLFDGDGRATAVIAPAPGSEGRYVLPRDGGVRGVDLFGNPLPPGHIVEREIAYLTTDAGIAALRSAMTRERDR